MLDKSLQGMNGDKLSEIFPREYRSSLARYSAPVEHLTKVVQSLFCPQDKNHFNRLLKGSCASYAVEQRQENYLPVKAALIGLRVRFVERYKFLKEACKLYNLEDSIPNVNFKEGGVLNVWMDLTPELSRSSFKVALVNERFSSLGQFMEKYFHIVDNLAALSEKARTYSYAVNLPQLRKARESHPSPSGAKKMMSMVPEGEGELSQSHWEAEEEDAEFPYSGTNPLSEVGEHVDDEPVAVMAMGKPEPKQVCHRKLLNGKCDSNSCNFDHSPLRINSERERLVHNWRNEKEAKTMPPTPTSSASIPSLLKKPSPGYQYPGERKTQDVRVMDSRVKSDEERDSKFLNLISSLLATPTSGESW